jgi:asparagine synthase (glutamine-hydrolysing)
MCGIAGGIDAGHHDLSIGLDRALAAIAHRGPDDEGRHIGHGVCLGMRRLAIIDRAHGHQPVFNEDGSIGVVFNGEIYNYRELMERLQSRGHRFQTQSDTETLVHLYEDYGEDLCRHLRGMFAFAIWDAKRRELFLARDRLGKKPLYFSRTAHGLVFASEVKALLPLLHAAGTQPTLHEEALYDYLSLGCVPQPATIYAGVQCLPAGAWCRIDASGTFRQVEYWSPERVQAAPPIPYEEALERTRTLVADAVRCRLESEVPLGVFLSAGVDSSVVAYEASRALGGTLRTYTVAVADQQLDESPIAARTAQALGVKNDILRLDLVSAPDLAAIIRHFDQPFADSSAIPSFAVSRAARQNVTVVLNGDGGDETFAGYRRHLAAAWTARLGWLPARWALLASQSVRPFAETRRSPLGFTTRFLRGLAHQGGARYLHWTTDLLREPLKSRIWLGSRQRPTESWLDTLAPADATPLRRQMLTDLRVNLVSGLLVKMDMASMAASLEARSPLLDHSLVELTASLPDAYLTRGGTPKALLRDAYAGLLPAEVLRGRKRGFEIPLREWLTGGLRPLVHDMLGRPNAFVRTLLDGRFIDDVLGCDHLPDMRWEGVVYALLVLELWADDSRSQGILP